MQFSDIYKGFQFVAVVARINEGNLYYIVDAKDPDLIKFLREGTIDFDDLEIKDIERIPTQDGLYEVVFEVQAVDTADETFDLAILTAARLRWYANLEAHSSPPPTREPQKVNRDDLDEEMAQHVGSGLGAFRF